MTASRACPAILCAGLLLAAPILTWAGNAQGSPGQATKPQPAQAQPLAGEQETASKKEKKEAKKEEKREAKAEAADATGLFWKDRPVLQIGRNFEMGLRVKLQGVFISSQLDLAPFGYSNAPSARRERLGVKGTALQHLEYEIEYDFVKGGEWKDVYGNLKYLPFAQLQVGKFKIPFGYELLTGAVDLDFVYRTRASESLASGRDTGVMLHGRLHKKSIQYEVGYFKHDGDNSPTLTPPPLRPGEVARSQDGAFAARLTVEPLKLGKTPAHLNNLSIGGSVVVGTIPEGQNNLHGHMVLSDNFFHRDFYVNGRRLRIGAEASWAPGPYSISAEYLRSSEQRLGQGVGNEQGPDNDLPPIVGTGWYVAATWAVTGEKKEGGIKPKRPLFQGGIGAIEIGARFEKLGFASTGADTEPQSKSTRAANVRRNAERAITVGVNWYWNRWVKLQFNGIRESIDDPGRGPTPLSPKTSWMSFVTQLQFVM